MPTLLDSVMSMTNDVTTTVLERSLQRGFVHEWIIQILAFRQALFLQTIEPIIVFLLGPGDPKRLNPHASQDAWYAWMELDELNNQHVNDAFADELLPNLWPYAGQDHISSHHRRLGFLPSYVSSVKAFKETSMSFATLIMLFLTLSCVFLIFLSCFYHNQKCSPLFISPRRHRLPKLVPPPLPVDGFLSWVRICFLLSDEEIIHRIGYDSLIFLRFHRLALRCIVKMSVFSFIVLLPLNFTGGGHTNAQDLKEAVGTLFSTDFLRFSMANVMSGSPRLWVHCFAAYLLTGIVVRELLIEYECFNSIRHRYLLSREPHLRTVLVTNIPRHLRSATKITNYFKHVYPDAVHDVFMCQNLIQLENLVRRRTLVLSKIEKELLLLCRKEKKKLYEQVFFWQRPFLWLTRSMEHSGCIEGSQERLAKLYASLDEYNGAIEAEQRRRRRVMKMLDRMEAAEGAADIDYVLASPFVTDMADPEQRKVLGLPATKRFAGTGTQKPPRPTNPHHNSGSDNVVSQTNIVTATHLTPGPVVHHAASGVAVVAIPEGDETADEVQHGMISAASGAAESAVPAMSASSRAEEQKANRLRARSPGNVTNGDTGVSTTTASTSPVAELAAAVATRDDSAVHLNTQGTASESMKGTRKKRLRTFADAKQAIRRYGRFHKDHNILGKPIRASVDSTDNEDGKMEDHINEVTDKAFVVMRTFTAATIAIQSMHSSKPGSMQVTTAPEPRDILWKNIYVSKGAHRTRTILGELVVLLIITFYVVPVALVSLLVSESALISSSPRLAQLDQASAFFSAAIALVQPLCIVGLQQLLPPLFIMIGEAEGLTAFSDVQMRAFSRYFLFQVVNVFLVTTIAGSIFDTLAQILVTPEAAFEMLGNSLPRMSSFFITFVTIKAFLALGFELVRIMALVQATVRYFLFPNATLRLQRTVVLGMRAIDDPGWFPFHKILAQDMLVVVISVVFAVVAPLILLPCTLFCLFSRIMWTHHHLYVYESVFESGGQFWPKIFRRFVFGLIIAQMTITGQFILKEARHEAYATMALSGLTYIFLRSTRARYDPTSSTLPLEVATVMDISLQQEEDARVAEEGFWQQQSQQQNSEPPVSGATPVAWHPRGPGSRIGRYDPFCKAYLQPALRANPRARPEQPFPVAQLGRPDVVQNRPAQCKNSLKTDESTADDDWQDTGATVRLKSMNQHDRRLINRCWNDQLQRAGAQDYMSILIGEECGTLKISGPAASSLVDADFVEQPTLAQSSSFV